MVRPDSSRALEGRSALALVLGLVLVLAGCSAAGRPAGVSCASDVTFRGGTYVNLRIIDSDAMSAADVDAYGGRIGTATYRDCYDTHETQDYEAVEVPGVDPAVAILVDDGSTSVYAHDDLPEEPARWPAGLTAFLANHPEATDM